MALAKALINRPDVLLLDEPTASLDPDTADWVRGYLKDYQAETHATILLASHNMGEVERLCDDVILLQAGRVFDRGSPRELIERFGREDMEEVFLDMARGRGRGLEALQEGRGAMSGSIATHLRPGLAPHPHLAQLGDASDRTRSTGRPCRW